MDAIWEGFVDLILPMGPLREERSRYGDKPAIFLHSREIAHRENAGLIDLRITRQAWTRLRTEWQHDPAVTASPRRRDWNELAIASAGDLTRLAPLIVSAVQANR